MSVEHGSHESRSGSRNTPDEYKGHVSIVFVSFAVGTDDIFIGADHGCRFRFEEAYYAKLHQERHGTDEQEYVNDSPFRATP